MDEQLVNRFQFSGQDIPTLLDHWEALKPDHPFLVWVPHEGKSRTWTYGDFRHDVRRVAAGLAERGLGKGDRLLIHSENCPEMLLAWYACAELGAIGVTTNTRSAGAEIRYFVEHTGCLGAITQPQFTSLLAENAPDLSWIVVTADNSGRAPTAAETAHGGDRFETLLGDPTSLLRRPAEPMLPAGIIFTSGTTARPKAVVHTHANALWAGRVGPLGIDFGGDDTYLVYLPFFHVNAQSWSVWTTLGVGGTIVLQPKFSAKRFWEVVVAHHVSHISIIPFIVSALADQPLPEHGLKVGVFGRVMPQYEKALGCRVVPAFGMTETVIHATGTDYWRRYPVGSMGVPTPGYELIVVDPETGDLCVDGETGELWVRGARGIQMFLEYYDNSDAMARSFSHDGWFRTGDMVRVGEEGNYFYSERDKDLLKVGGENVSAREIEDVCRKLDGVADVAVVGRQHEMLGVVPVAFVIASDPNPDAVGLEMKIIELCAANLADFKVPRKVTLVEDFPRATLNKVAKHRLRDLADSAQRTTKGDLDAD